jgi:acetoin utilization deacetylase AcuC-like enzyme
MLPFKLVYCENYDLHLGDHVFPSSKYRLIHQKLLAERFADHGDFLAPEPARDEDVLLVHGQEWVRKLRCGLLNYTDILRLEIPYSREMVDAVWLSAGGSILAARRALRDGGAINVGGGFHHAFPDHGEGFCAVHDVAVAIRRLQADGAIRRALVVDCDVHQGNGTAHIFGGDDSVFTVSLHQSNNYPSSKPPSDLDVDLNDGVGDNEYLDYLGNALDVAFQAANGASPSGESRGSKPSGESRDSQFDLLCYVGGADPYCQDQLGGLALTMEGLQRRDLMVFQAARRHGVPVMVTLAGGYAHDLGDTVQIHVNTAHALAEALRAAADPPATAAGSDSAEPG